MDLKKVASVSLITFVIFSAAFLAYKELGQGSSPANSAGAKIGGEQSNNESATGNSDVTGVGGIAAEAAAGAKQISQDPQNTPGAEGQKDVPGVNETTGTDSAGTAPVAGEAAEKSDAAEAPAAGQAKAQAGANKVIAYYFHPKYTCSSCYITENYIKEALNQYPDQLQSGTLEFRSIDVDRPENRHFLQEYQVAANSMVLTLQSGGSVIRSSNLSGVFLYSGDKAKLIQYVKGEVGKYLQEVE